MRAFRFSVGCFLLAIATPCLALIAYQEPVDLEEQQNNDLYKILAVRAVNDLNTESNDLHHWKLEKLLSAKKQLVAGLKYKLKFVIARSECRKEGDEEKVSLNLCAVRDDAPKQVCHYEIIVREWDNTEDFINRGCHRQNDHKSTEHQLRHRHEERKATSENDGEGNMLKVGEAIKPKDYGAWNLFSAFVDRHSKVYATKREILKRFKIYKHNVRAAKMWQDNEQGTAIYGETQFMDLTAEEFRNIYLPYKWQDPKHPIRELSDWEIEEDDEIPDAFDWRKKGVVTDIKNQEACGSCWAFSVTGNIEGQYAKKTGKLIPLSEQELLDCDIVDQACNGGLPMNAYKEIIRIGGLEPEKDYPYDARKETCHLARQEIAVYINDSVKLPSDEGKMAVWMFKNGPISIGVNAMPLQFYRHGISHPWKILCSPSMLNHGVLIVGYGQEGDKPFWIIKNSWGARWGESGYYRLYRGKNVCGVNEMATSAIIL